RIAAETGGLTGVGVEGSERAARAEAGIIFQRVEAAEHLERRVLEVVAELHTVGGEVAERAGSSEAGCAEGLAAPAVDEKAVRELVMKAAVAIPSVKAWKIAVGVGLRVGQTSAKSDRQTGSPIAERAGLGVGHLRAQTYGQSQSETETARETRH